MRKFFCKIHDYFHQFIIVSDKTRGYGVMVCKYCGIKYIDTKWGKS